MAVSGEGFASGFIEGGQAAQASQLTGIKIDEAKQDLQINDLKIQQAKRALDVQDRMMQKIASMGTGGKPSPGDAVNQAAYEMFMMGQVQLESGLPAAASASFKTASTLMRNQSYIDKNETDQQMKNLSIVQARISPDTVHNQQDFDQAQQIIEMETGHRSPFYGKPYSPELVKMIHDTATTTKDQALIKQREAQAKKLEKDTEIADYTLNTALPARTRLVEARIANLNKTGAKQLIPTTGDLKGITDLAEEHFGGSGAVDPSTLRNASRAAAEQARNDIVNNHMEPSKAYQKAFNTAYRNGEYAGLKAPKERPGTSKNAPRPFEPDASKLQENQWYLMKNGQAAVYQSKVQHKDGTVGPGYVVPDEHSPPNDEVDDEIERGANRDNDEDEE